MSAPVLNLILFMVRRGRIEHLPGVAAEFRRLDDERKGVIHAVATTARRSTRARSRLLTARLEQMTGGRSS